MLEWLAKFWLEALMTGLIGGIGIAAKYAWTQIKKEFEGMRQTQTDLKSLKESIDNKFDNIETKINDMSEISRSTDVSLLRDALLRKLRYILSEVDPCVTLDDLETINSLMTQYEKLGGNGEIHKLYKRFEKIHVCPEHEHHDHYEYEEQI